MSPRTISCGSLSKTYSITGWRLGYVIAAPEVIAGARKVHDFLTVGAAAPLQEAAVAGLTLPESYYAELQASYTAKRDLFLGFLRQTGLRFTEPEGAYYVMVDIAESGWTNDRAFCDWLVKDVGVAAVPGSSFFRDPVTSWIRFHFAKKSETLEAAGQRLVGLRERAAKAKEKV
jgi:aminotransferase